MVAPKGLTAREGGAMKETIITLMGEMNEQELRLLLIAALELRKK